ncbi:purine-cytosine permease family protein [Embleya sp. NPDC001921]
MTNSQENSANPVFGVETHGFEHIPEADRTMTFRETRFFWVGTNANLFFVSVGAIAVGLGLSLWQALLACLVGNLLFALVGWAAIGGTRAGLPTVTFTRAVFGVRGNRLNAFLAWVASVAFEAINTIFGVYALVALFPLLGWHHPGTPGKLIAVLTQLLLGGGIAVLGHATMVYLQRFFAVLLSSALVLVLAFGIQGIDWNLHAQVSGTTALAVFLVACATIASGPISYLYNSPDWVRYLPSRTPSRRIFWNVACASGLSAFFLCCMGALLASRGDMSDPVGGVEAFVPTWVFVVYILAAVGGSIANNVVTYYSSGLALQAVGVPLHRYTATAADTVLSTALVLYVLFVRDFTTVLSDFVALLIVWLGPFAGVWMTDGLLRRWRYDPVAAHATRREQNSRYWGWHGVEPRGWAALAAGVGACLLTVNAPVYQGPLSRALDGADLSWFLGFLVSAAVYVAIAGRSTAAEAATSPDVETEPAESSGLRSHSDEHRSPVPVNVTDSGDDTPARERGLT